MKNLLLASLLVLPLPSLAASAGVPFPPASVVLHQAPATAPATSSVSDDEDDEEEDDEGTPPAVPTSKPAPGEAVEPSTAAADEKQPAASPAPAVAPGQKAREQELVSGAPLYNPNVAVHIVEKKQFADSGKNEIALYPAAVQVNGKFAQHIGSAVSYTYHLNENFGLQITPQYNWHNQEAPFNQELVDKVGQVPQAATSLLVVWSTQAGVEVTPIYGKFAFYEGNLAHFSFVLNGGAGVGSTRSQIKQRTRTAAGAEIPATYGDTGIRFMGSVGAGFRVQIGSRFALRLELRDLVYTARVDSVNGCDAADLGILDGFIRRQSGAELSQASVSGSCKVDKFEGTTEEGYERRRDVPLALALVKTPSSDVLNNVGFYAGFAFLF